MTTFLITYDLLKPGKDYTNLFKTIESLSRIYWHGMQNVWFVKSNQLSADSIRDALSVHVDANDIIFVAELGNWASWHLTGWEWINQ
ncbi:MAG: hypothetical protein A3B38_04315 [Candidatus Levybacteria bacterium RIFCSPLOWO2_01_FULL_36_13]|nr:MAG: hypothetical protein A2684_00060 [Candidatus Levybacteria bacterium RIFCSPHIGHO2_01_FULL_36_15b]OGH34053.1 MAG: hypothetical protein A3B38_04315 [Candidatus Levybacteria bacterium RIFCSPLOWO2_01_FULL_36_13]